MLIFALLLMPLFQIQATPTNLPEGSWVNQDSATLGLSAIVFDRYEGHLRVPVWAKCEPMDCDWGTTAADSWNGLTRSVFDMGFVTATMEFISLPDGRLLVVSKDDYKDKSVRNDPEHVEFFVREQAIQDPDSIAAKVLLKKVAETYRTISSARFESETFSESIGRLSTRSTTVSKTAILQPGKLRNELTGSRESEVLISDGKTLWTFFPASNEYNSRPIGTQSIPGSTLESFTLLDQVRGPTKIIGPGRVGDTECTMVAIGRDDDHRRTIWIDAKTNFVRKEERKDISAADGGNFSSASVTTFSVATSVDHLDAALFTFDPAKIHAKERSQIQKEAAANRLGTPAPDFTLRDLDGKDVRLSELRGKVVLLDFWATWCGSCREAMPALELLHRQVGDKGLVVLGIDDEDSKEQSAFLREFGYSFSSLVDPTKTISNLLHVGPIPTTILIDREGKIRTFDIGGASYETLRGALHDLGVFDEGARN